MLLEKLKYICTDMDSTLHVSEFVLQNIMIRGDLLKKSWVFFTVYLGKLQLEVI